MSDVEIPIVVARAQVASAVNIVVQLTRFVEDGSRKITRISEMGGLDDAGHYQFEDIFKSQLKGRTNDGSLLADLAWTGTKPSFSTEPYQHGMEDRIELTANLWGE
jgi:pilus assembly protein CpaF